MNCVKNYSLQVCLNQKFENVLHDLLSRLEEDWGSNWKLFRSKKSLIYFLFLLSFNSNFQKSKKKVKSKSLPKWTVHTSTYRPEQFRRSFKETFYSGSNERSYFSFLFFFWILLFSKANWNSGVCWHCEAGKVACVFTLKSDIFNTRSLNRHKTSSKTSGNL